MKRVLALLACATALSAAYVYYLNDPLTSINASNWRTNGTISAGSGGLTSTSSAGSIISTLTAPGGTPRALPRRMK